MSATAWRIMYRPARAPALCSEPWENSAWGGVAVRGGGGDVFADLRHDRAGGPVQGAAGDDHWIDADIAGTIGARSVSGWASGISDERAGRAQQDREEFERNNQPHLAYLASKWEEWYQRGWIISNGSTGILWASLRGGDRGAYSDSDELRDACVSAAGFAGSDDLGATGGGNGDEPAAAGVCSRGGCGCRSARIGPSGIIGCRRFCMAMRGSARGWRSLLRTRG